MNLIIGREGKQTFSIHDIGVSRKHVNLELQENGNVTIEDLNSANGTYVNGQRIIKKQIQLTDEVRLGPSYLLNVMDVIRIMKATAPSSSKQSPAFASKTELSPAEKERIRTEFEKLAGVYDKYKCDIVELKKSKGIATVMRMVPAVVTSVATFLIPLFLEGEAATTCKLILGGISIILICVITYRMLQMQKKTPELERSLKEEFQKNYVCPKCGRYLGDEPFENFKKSGVCIKCKTEWL